MALKTVSQLKQAIKRKNTGLVIDQFEDIDGSIEEAARTVLSKVSIPEASGRLTMKLYDNVYDYSPSNLGKVFGTSLVDFRSQGHTRNATDKVYKKGITAFDQTKHLLPNGYMITFEYDEGTPIMRVASPKPTQRVVLDTIDSTTGWTLAGEGSGLTLDETDYYESPASLRFALTGTGLTPTATLTKTIDQVDLSTYEDLGVVFLAVKIPTASALTSITLRLGSSDSAYDSVTATSGFTFSFKNEKWMLLAFDFSTATSTGTPDWSAIDYVQLRILHTAAMTNFRIGALFICIPSPHELIYETAAIFKAPSASPLQSITGDSDEIVLTDAAYTLLEKEACRTVAKDVGGNQSRVIVAELDEELDDNGGKPGLYSLYQQNNPSQRVNQTTNYYQGRRIRK